MVWDDWLGVELAEDMLNRLRNEGVMFKGVNEMIESLLGHWTDRLG